LIGGVAAVVAGSLLLAAPVSAGLTEVISLYDNEPVSIPNGHGAAKMPFAMNSSTRTVSAASASFRVRHQRTQQLKLLLKGPNDARVVLSDGLTEGENLGQHQCGEDRNAVGFTAFRDSGPSQILDFSAPYVGNFFPQEPLDPVEGIHPEGDWTLIVKDSNPNGEPGKLLCGLVVLVLPPN
jgi:hypothetical protein